MKRTTLPLLTLMVLAASLFYLSCNKSDWKGIVHNPHFSKCDVAEYHLPYYDEYDIGFPFLFKKKYGYSGKMVNEIDCSFWNVIHPDELRRHILLVQQKGNKLFLLDKNKPNDTVMKAHLSNRGRVEYYETNGNLDVNEYVPLTFAHFIYKNNRLVAISSGNSNNPAGVDSLHYDIHGNLLAFRNNFYEYDYTRTAKQQFYIDDIMEGTLNGYYLLQYLGFFPEVTSPPNLRSHVDAVVFVGKVENHTFDAWGKLTGYQFNGPATIVWNCK